METKKTVNTFHELKANSACKQKQEERKECSQEEALLTIFWSGGDEKRRHKESRALPRATEIGEIAEGSREQASMTLIRGPTVCDTIFPPDCVKSGRKNIVAQCVREERRREPTSPDCITLGRWISPNTRAGMEKNQCRVRFNEARELHSSDVTPD